MLLQIQAAEIQAAAETLAAVLLNTAAAEMPVAAVLLTIAAAEMPVAVLLTTAVETPAVVLSNKHE